MLSKLIKHEFRALSRFLLPIHILLLVACLIGRFMFQAMAMMDLPNVILIVSFVFLISIWIVVPCATSILIVVRYYKSLYTDEGYLTLTLPATRGQLLFSKAFAACVWSILDLAIVIAGLAIVVIIPQVYQNSAEALNELEKSIGDVTKPVFLVNCRNLCCRMFWECGTLLFFSIYRAAPFFAQSARSNHCLLCNFNSFFCIDADRHVCSWI